MKRLCILWIWDFNKDKNLNFKQKKYVVENDFKIKLYEVFKEDILMIERITRRNLDKWKL